MSELNKKMEAPYRRSKVTVGSIMSYVIIALLPTTAFGIYTHGISALLVIVLTVLSAVLTEYLYQILTKTRVTISDCNAALTGLILALNLPANTPWWICIIGGCFSILIVKQVVCRFGKVNLNPSLTAKCFLLVLFFSKITSMNTPLAIQKAGEPVDLLNVVLGNTNGTIGTTSVVAVLIGAIFLIVMGIIDLSIPASYLISFVIVMGILGGRGFELNYLTVQICGGGLMFAAWFMATDYMSSPITKWGRIIYGIFLGVLTALLRLVGITEDASCFAIVCGNLLVPIFDRIHIPFYRKKK